ncbi:MAG: molybdopterin-synthase adenylyltransferase MoeB [Pseudomonadota bacterium]
MDDQLLLRYSRQVLLPQIDIGGQQALIDARAVIIGVGGLGSPIAMYLASAGVGELCLIDHDCVELSNLQRQIVHATSTLGQLKVESAANRLKDLNPEVRVECVAAKLEDCDIDARLESADVVLDATDNFATRYAINDACARAKVPLVSGAAIRFEGQVSVFHPGRDDAPCYRCLYSEASALEETCVQTGVVAPLLGIIGSIQALEAIKILIHQGSDLTGRLLLLDGLSMEWQTMRFGKDPKCPVCAGA